MDRRNRFLESVVVLDTETTNKDKFLAEVIEFGYVTKNNNGYSLFNELYKPESNGGIVKPEISAVTHITTKMVADKPLFSDSIQTDMFPCLKKAKDNGAIVAHNAAYDITVLNRYDQISFDGIHVICTMRLAKHLFMLDDTVEFFNLGYLRYRFDLDIPENMEHHRASSDAFITMKLLEFLISYMEENDKLDKNRCYIEQLEELSSSPIFMPKMMFGKHVGKEWHDIPNDYIVWMLNNLVSLDDSDPLYDGDLAHTLDIICTIYIEEGVFS